jgi:CRP/FNR family cyclic AMP-dependent transcriptional regulator
MGHSQAFLERLDGDTVAALAERWVVHSYTPHQMILAQGETGRDVFFILEGQVRVTLFSSNGRETFYGDRGPGDIIGE